MTDREKLIALLDEARAKRGEICYAHTDCNSCVFGEDGENCGDAMIADHLITNGVVVREKGEWVDDPEIWRCDKCLEWLDIVQGTADMNYCPHCGADMREGENG